MPHPRLAIFVDGANMDIGSRAAGIKIDYQKFRAFLGGTRLIVSANYYNSKSRNPAEMAFYHRVEEAGFTLVLGPRKIPGQRQKEIDVQIAVNMVSGAFTDLLDNALLVTGDGDLAPAVRKLLALQRQVEVASFDDPSRKEFSWSLKSIASRTIDLTLNIQKFKL